MSQVSILQTGFSKAQNIDPHLLDPAWTNTFQSRGVQNLTVNPHLGGSVARSANPDLQLVGYHEDQPTTTIPLLAVFGAVGYVLFKIFIE